MKISPQRHLLYLTLSAIALKALLLFWALPLIVADEPVNASMFPDGYDLIAWNLANGNGYRMFEDTSLTMLRTPGFVIVLAGVFAVAGKSLVTVQLMNLALSILTAILVFKIARGLFDSENVAAIAALLVFFHPGTLVSDSRGGPESLLTLLIALILLLCISALNKPRFRTFTCLGCAFGAALLVKSSIGLILPGVLVWEYIRLHVSPKRNQIIGGFILAGLVAGLCLTPWIARNFAISGKFVPTMTVGSLAAFQGQQAVIHRSSDKEYGLLLNDAAERQLELAREMNLPVKGYYFQQFYSVQDELAFYSELGRRTWTAYWESPSLVARAIIYNAIAFWVQGRTARSTVVNTFIAIPLLLLVAIGFVQALHQRRDISLLIVFTLCFLLPHLMFMSMARYYIPLLPILSILAAVPIATLCKRFRPQVRA